MSIETEIRDFLNANLKESDTKSRDIDLVIYFYGFRENLWPTLEDAASRFDVGESEGRRSERPRQIINRKFKEIVNLNDLPSLNKFSEHLKSSGFHTSSTLTDHAESNQLFDSSVNLVSLLRLLKDLGECKDYNPYTINLNKLTRPGFDTSQEIFFIKDSSVIRFKKALKKSKTIPGLLGIAKINYLRDDATTSLVDHDTLVSLIKLNSDSWFFDSNGEQFYLFESRDNTLVNNLEKVKNITKLEDIDILTKVLSNALKRRTPPKKRSYPPENVIRQYLLSSKYTKINNSIVTLIIEAENLNDVEQAATNYMKKNNVHDFPKISEHLKSLGYKNPLIDKTVRNSPLIFVDKSKGQNHYKYHLVGSNVSRPDSNINKYENFRQRLIKASSEGTDGSHKAKTRKEHHILGEWLFKDKNHEKCAICNKKYSVKSLITAHKKKRSQCAENERTDPNIVMPLCIFGCDYLYENQLIFINSGKVQSADRLAGNYFSELEFIDSIDGNELDPRWLKGSESYFPKPRK